MVQLVKYKKLTPGFGVFFDPSKTTSGQRFFAGLYNYLKPWAIPFDKRPCVVLFNISVPWSEVVRARIRGQKIVIRVDGLYFDKLSSRFIDKLPPLLRFIFRLGIRYPRLHNFLAHFANLFEQNYTGFFRILLADYLIYQSEFSKRIHNIYFPNKPHTIIVNGSEFLSIPKTSQKIDYSYIQLVTIYDGWKPAKRVYDVMCFVRWLRERHQNVCLYVLGYSGTIPVGLPSDMRHLLENSTFIKTIPRFNNFNQVISQILADSDCYISFSYRDPCPNAIVEAMAHGLPVLALASGGVPDIVGNAGRLIPVDDFADGFFSDHRFGTDFAAIDFEYAYDALKDILENLSIFRRRVRKRFNEQLELKVAANEYRKVLESLIF